MTPYEFAILRYQHNPVAGEVVNVGVVMWLPTEKRLLHRVIERYGRLSEFFRANFEGGSYRQMVRLLASRFDQVDREISGEIQLDLLDRMPDTIDTLLPYLVPDPDSCFQWSLVMAGIAPDPEERLQELVREFVERHEEPTERPRRDESEIWAGVERRLRSRHLLDPGKVRMDVPISTPDYSYTFKTGWSNGVPQVLEPISLDHENPAYIVDKANNWSGRLFTLSRGPAFQMTAIIAPPTRETHLPAYRRAWSILSKALCVRDLVEEANIDSFLPEIERDLEGRRT